jgi:hypothetical protein
VAKNRNWGGVRIPGEGKKLGRPLVVDSMAGRAVTVYLTESEIEYLALWQKNRSAALREIIDRAIKFWPQGV